MRRIGHLLAGTVLLAGCAGEGHVTQPRRLQSPTAAATLSMTAAVQQDIATLRRVTAAFHDTAAAAAAGWSTQITPCMASLAGGMGFHYGNVALIDDSVRVDQPELLMYEPEKNGRMRLVGVEYIVPQSEWTSGQPPHLFGQDFHVNSQFQVWALHVWAWEENPNGIFSDWNPRVTCQFAG